MIRRAVSLLMVLSAACSACRGAPPAGQPPGDLPTYTARETSAPIRIDGVLDEPAWKAAESATFKIWDGSGPASQETTARLCWDDKNLYIAFWCADTDIYATYTRRDQDLWKEDAVEVFLNPSGDLIHYEEIEVSPRNAIFDLEIENRRFVGGIFGSDASWDCPGLRTAVHLDGTLNQRGDADRGWTVEMAIPFASLRSAPPARLRKNSRWRMNLTRADLYPKREYDCWSPTLGGSADFHKSYRFGSLVFKE